MLSIMCLKKKHNKQNFTLYMYYICSFIYEQVFLLKGHHLENKEVSGKAHCHHKDKFQLLLLHNLEEAVIDLELMDFQHKTSQHHQLAQVHKDKLL